MLEPDDALAVPEGLRKGIWHLAPNSITWKSGQPIPVCKITKPSDLIVYALNLFYMIYM
jgi:hypothetical protein